MEITHIPIGLIDPPDEPHRLAMDSVTLEELAASIRLEGLQLPLTVRPLDTGRYEIIAGHRRYCALKMIGALDAPSIVRQAGAADNEVARFLENAQRENLSPMGSQSRSRASSPTQASNPKQSRNAWAKPTTG